MTTRHVLAPEAALDLVEIWRYIKEQGSFETAHRVESAILDRIILLARMPHAGHSRKDLTDESVKFFPIYSYLIVYRPETKPSQIVSILQQPPRHRENSLRSPVRRSPVRICSAG